MGSIPTVSFMENKVFNLDSGTVMYTYDYPRPAVTVDIGLVANGYLLLIRRGKDPYKGRLALPGGFLNIDETGLQAAHREFEEETSAQIPKNVELRLLTVADDVDRDPRGRVISLVYEGFTFDHPFLVKGADDAKEAIWIPITQIDTMGAENFAFDHHLLIQWIVSGWGFYKIIYEYEST